MKTAKIDFLKKEVLIIELPRVCDYYLYEDMLYIFDNENDKNYRFKGSFSLLGKPDEIKESDAIPFVSISDDFWDYKDYNNNNNSFRTALESFNSAIETEIYWNVNPIKIIPRGEASEHERVKNQNEFYEAQEKTFDRQRTLIFLEN